MIAGPGQIDHPEIVRTDSRRVSPTRKTLTDRLRGLADPSHVMAPQALSSPVAAPTAVGGAAAQGSLLRHEDDAVVAPDRAIAAPGRGRVCVILVLDVLACVGRGPDPCREAGRQHLLECLRVGTISDAECELYELLAGE